MKIGFLALSGIRAHDPELLARGLTLPGFVERSKQVAALPSLGLLILAACTPEGHELAYFEAPSGEEVPAAVFDCDLVAISTFSAQVFEAYAIADRLRRVGVSVAMGGLHVSVLPDEAREHADWVVVGEGENVWPEVVRRADLGERGAILNADDFPPVDVARLPVPRYDLLRGRRYNRFTVQTTRGCPYRCEFCASNVMLGKPYRKRPVDHVVRDIRAIQAEFPHAFIEFADDNTFVDEEWGRELLDAITPLGIKWFTETDVSVADDEELLARLAPAGCRQLLIGLEAAESRSLTGLEARSDFKARRAPGYADAVRKIQAAGVTVNGCFVLGLDGQTTQSFQDVLDFAERTNLFEVQVTLQTAFPGTPLYERLSAAGRILEPRRWDLCTLFDVNFEPTDMTVEELRAGIVHLSEELYSTAALERRRRPFFENHRRRVREGVVA